MNSKGSGKDSLWSGGKHPHSHRHASMTLLILCFLNFYEADTSFLMGTSNPRELGLSSLMQEHFYEMQIALDNIINCIIMRTEQNQKNKIIIVRDE